MLRTRNQRSPRRRIRWLTALSLPLLAAAFAAPAGTAEAFTASCPQMQRLAVGGVGDPLSTRVPGSAAATGVVYPASIAPVGPIPGDISVVGGEAALDAGARLFRMRCPESAIHVSGYSLGALVAGNVRDRWNHDPMMRRNVSFTLIADPRADEGAMSRLPSLIPGLTHVGKRPPSQIPTSSICRSVSDFVCHSGNPLTHPFRLLNGVLGYAFGDHGYRDSEIVDEPGEHTVAGVMRVGEPETLEISAPPMAAALPSVAQWPAPVFDTAPVIEAAAAALVPPAPLSLTEYTPTPLRDYAPPVLAPMFPAELGDVVLPPLPRALAGPFDQLISAIG